MPATCTPNGEAKAKTKRSPTKSRVKRNAGGAATRRLSRAESNRLNAQKSTGPRTEEGKAKSRYNALTHGMTAESTVLPGEEAAEFEARARQLHADLGPCNALEAALLDGVARAEWLSVRADHAAIAWTSHRVRHEPLERDQAERERATVLGQNLLHRLDKARPSSPQAGAGGIAHPARLVLQLEKSIPGCDWIIGRFRQLESRIGNPGLWTLRDGYELVRLLGHFMADAITEYPIAYVILASHFVAGASRSRTNAHLMNQAMKIVDDYERLDALLQHAIEATPEEPPANKAEKAEFHEPDRCEGELPGERDPKVLALVELIELCKPAHDQFRDLPLERLLPASADEAAPEVGSGDRRADEATRANPRAARANRRSRRRPGPHPTGARARARR